MLKRIKKLLGLYQPDNVTVYPYRSYGSGRHLYVKGRVLDNKPLLFRQRQSFLRTLLNAIVQFNTLEIPDADVVLNVGAMRFQTRSDKKGYFLFDLLLSQDISMLADAEGWVEFWVFAPDFQTEAQAHAGELLIPAVEADFGIISDIDDTILKTGVTSLLKWRLLFNSFFVNAFKRQPLEGSEQTYRALHKGVAGQEKNPVFYLSNSPWNLYAYLQEFLDHRAFPKGPLLLRSFNSMFQRLAADEKPHKQREIINLLQSYPELPFILIGDSGEHDASIYTDIAAQYPDRVLCIYLRTVNHRKRMKRVRSIVDKHTSTPLLLIHQSGELLADAKARGSVSDI